VTQIQQDNHRGRRVPDETGSEPISRHAGRSRQPSGVTLLWSDTRHPGQVRALSVYCGSDLDHADLPARLRRPEGLLLAACRLINQQLAHPGLDAAFIAGRLGCSRATLYRAFAHQNLAVAGYIREQRLQQVWSLLHTLPDAVPIAEVARRCGFLDSTSFSRLFRRRFGVRARDVRAGG
jgi:AraC-like DNA-binding protein